MSRNKKKLAWLKRKRASGEYVAQRSGKGARTRTQRPRDYREMRRKLRKEGRATAQK